MVYQVDYEIGNGSGNTSGCETQVKEKKENLGSFRDGGTSSKWKLLNFNLRKNFYRKIYVT